MIEVQSNLHAACTIYNNRLPDEPEVRTSPVPSQEELPAYNSLGCKVFDLESLTEFPGGYLLKLDYPLASSQCMASVLPFGYMPSSDPFVSPAIGTVFLAHLDDIWKLVVNVESCSGRAGPIHVGIWNFDQQGGSIKPMQGVPADFPYDT